MKPGPGKFDALIACLQGRPPTNADWVGVIEEANLYLVAPMVRASLMRWKGPEVPDDVRGYLDFIHERNLERNVRLRSQAVEAVEILNQCEIMPVLLKGACTLLTASEDRLGERILYDLDLMVPKELVPRALSCLSAIGYEALPCENGDHAPAALARWRDVGTIDLHIRPPGPEIFHHSGKLAESGGILPVGKGLAVLPSPTFRALHLIVHDTFHDRRYRNGDFDLRHLVELNELSRVRQGFDWGELAGLLMNDRRARCALDAQLLALRSLFGAEDLPSVPVSHTVPRLQHWRRLYQARHPGFRNFLMTIYGSSKRLRGTASGAV